MTSVLKESKSILKADKDLKVNELLSKMESLDYNEIRKIGSEVQQNISSDIDALVKKCSTLDCGDAGKALQQLTEITDTRIIESKNSFMHKITKPIRMLMSKGNSLDKNVDIVINNVTLAKDDLVESLNDLEILAISAEKAYIDLEPYEDALKLKILECEEYVKSLDSDSIDFIQANRLLTTYRRRLEDLATTRVVAYQTVKESLVLITGNQILADQMQYTLDNIVPLWKAQVITAAKVQVQKNSLDIQKHVRDSVNKLMVDTAKNISDNVKTINDLGNQTIIDVDKLRDVDRIMRDLVIDMRRRSEENTIKHKDTMAALSTLHNMTDVVKEIEKQV